MAFRWPEVSVVIPHYNDEASLARVVDAVRACLDDGLSFSRPTTIELDAAEDFLAMVPTADMVKFGKNGSDATTAAEAIGTDEAAYAEENLNPYVATERGLVDAVIEPSATRARVLEGLRLLERKVAYPAQKKHGNIPL